MAEAMGLSVLTSLLVGSLFSSIYSEAMESIYICFLVASEKGEETQETPRELKNLLELSRK